MEFKQLSDYKLKKLFPHHWQTIKSIPMQIGNHDPIHNRVLISVVYSRPRWYTIPKAIEFIEGSYWYWHHYKHHNN